MVIVVMGVTGCGKTTVGETLASELNWKFLDADDFHPPENKKKMRSGVPLTDDDRVPWLKALHNEVVKAIRSHNSIVLACSALKRAYRQMIRGDEDGVLFVYLKGHEELIKSRLEKRTNHFMNPKLLASQFNTLEEPTNALYVDISQRPDEIVALIRQELDLFLEQAHKEPA